MSSSLHAIVYERILPHPEGEDAYLLLETFSLSMLPSSSSLSFSFDFLFSDKGLCGGVNSFVAKQARIIIKENELAGNAVKVYGLGDKIRSALQRTFGDRFRRMMTEVTRYPWNFAEACLISERLMQVIKSPFCYGSFQALSLSLSTSCGRRESSLW